MEVVVITEAACPYSQRAIVGPLNELVTTPGIAEIMDLEHHPWGNSYFKTERCGGHPYLSDTRRCWAALCVGVPNPPEECFHGDIINQHGDLEGQVNRMDACAKRHAEKWETYWQFLLCMERDLDKLGLGASRRCASEESHLDPDALEACYRSMEGDQALIVEANATIDHISVPYVAVNGQQVETESVLEEVCLAYTGARPASCAPYNQSEVANSFSLFGWVASVWPK